MTNEFSPSPELSPDDQRVLDALVDAGFNTDGLEAPTPAVRDRAAAVSSLFELLEDYPVEDADETLVHATLARVDRLEDGRAARMNFDNANANGETGPQRRIRLPDFISVAAVILIGASVVWPLTTHLRQQAIDTGCNSNLQQMALGFSQYAMDYNGAMPTARTGLFSAWTPGAHNVINLNPLLQNGYCDQGHLNCPGNEGGFADSYSYQFQVNEYRPRWSAGSTTVVLGDRNPIIDAVRRRQVIGALTVSINHGGRGQFVLSSDGATNWLVQPVVGTNDNIWLPGGVIFLRSGDRLTDPTDVFLAH